MWTSLPGWTNLSCWCTVSQYTPDRWAAGFRYRGGAFGVRGPDRYRQDVSVFPDGFVRLRSSDATSLACQLFEVEMPAFDSVFRMMLMGFSVSLCVLLVELVVLVVLLELLSVLEVLSESAEAPWEW